MSKPIILNQEGIIQNQQQEPKRIMNSNNLDKEISHVEQISQLFDIIQSDETNNYYGIDVQIERSKLKKIEKEGKLTLKSGQDIKTGYIPSITRKNILYLGKFTCEQPLEISTAIGSEALSLIDGRQIAERINKMSSSDRTKITYIHLSTIQILVKSTYASIDTPIDIIVIDNRIISKNKKEQVLGMIKGNLKYGVIKFDVSLQFAIPLVTKNLNQSIGILYKFHRQDLMEKGDYPLSITYSVGYGLSNSHHSIDYIDKDLIHIDELFKNTSTKLVTFSKKEEYSNNLFTAPKISMIKPRESIDNLNNQIHKLSLERPSTSSNNQLTPPPNFHRKPENLQNLERQIQELKSTVTTLNDKI